MHIKFRNTIPTRGNARAQILVNILKGVQRLCATCHPQYVTRILPRVLTNNNLGDHYLKKYIYAETCARTLTSSKDF